MNISERIEELRVFRSLMGIDLSASDISRIWGSQYSKKARNQPPDRCNPVIEEKIQILQKNLNHFLLLDKVKFIGISGSVGAGFAKREDDIDLFIVVEDDFMWVYRLYLELSNLFNGKVRQKKHKNDVKDKFCVNLIAEERGVVFDNDIFNFHELMFLKPVYNKEYIYQIYLKNEWLFDDWGIKPCSKQEKYVKKNNVIKKVFDETCFLIQLSFMFISNHAPDLHRLVRNNNIGRIEFFPCEFKLKKIKEYKRKLASAQIV